MASESPERLEELRQSFLRALSELTSDGTAGAVGGKQAMVSEVAQRAGLDPEGDPQDRALGERLAAELVEAGYASAEAGSSGFLVIRPKGSGPWGVAPAETGCRRRALPSSSYARSSENPIKAKIMGIAHLLHRPGPEGLLYGGHNTSGGDYRSLMYIGLRTSNTLHKKACRTAPTLCGTSENFGKTNFAERSFYEFR